MAFWSSFPELNHNATMAIKGTYRKDELYLFCISSSDDQRVTRRIQATEEVTGTKFRNVIKPRGESELAKLFSLVHMGDYVTYHLANLRGVDPLDVSSIEALKEKLR
jgi:glucose/mannose-6-phosphate isomerase